MSDTIHPLDPLTAAEIGEAVAVLRASERVKPRMRFASVVLREPPKVDVIDWDTGTGGMPPREADVILLDNADGSVYEAVVSLGERRVVRWERVPGVQPFLLGEEAEECEAIVAADSGFQAALARRGIDIAPESLANLLMVEPWPVGREWEGVQGERRLVQAIAFLRSEPGDNGFARPIEGLSALVDLNEGKVVHIEDLGVVAMPPEAGNFAAKYISKFREDLQPLEIAQPNGPSFHVEGNRVLWQKWDFRVGWTPREGLVLHAISYEDDGRHRPILYRASFSEMVVPYGDPSSSHYRKNAFDVGEFGLGALANSLTLGCDCLGHIRYFDAVMSDATGAPRTLPNAICLHEEDHGILWKHTDWRTGDVEVRRSRRLVVSFIATVGNYDYAFYWHFYLDGSIECEVKLTGILAVGAMHAGETSAHGTLVAPQLYAPSHQHFFNVRLDMDVDGATNSVYETNTRGVAPGEGNPHGNAFVHERTLLATESAAQRRVDSTSARTWTVVNPGRANRLGQPVGYTLEPGGNVSPFAQPDASVLRRAPFLNHHLHVTPYAPDERFAAGEYPNQRGHGQDGLVHWSEADRNVAETDLVVWYTFGHHHIPRPEDWPVMPCASIGFRLKPNGFFERNPALDVPPSPPKHADAADASCCVSASSTASLSTG